MLSRRKALFNASTALSYVYVHSLEESSPSSGVCVLMEAGAGVCVVIEVGVAGGGARDRERLRPYS